MLMLEQTRRRGWSVICLSDPSKTLNTGFKSPKSGFKINRQTRMTIAFEYFPEYYSIFTVKYFTLINLGYTSIYHIELSQANISCDLAGIRGSSDIYMEHYNTYWNTWIYYELSIPHVPAVQEAKYMVASGDRKYPHQEYLFAMRCCGRIWLCTFGLLVLH